MTPDQLQAERTMLIGKLDTLCDKYYDAKGALPLAGDEHSPGLIDLRREIAVLSYRLSAHVYHVYGRADQSYHQRKYAIAKTVLEFRSNEIKTSGKPSPMNVLELLAQEDKAVAKSHDDEIWASAERESLKAKLDFCKQVLAALQQEISVLAQEARTAHYQSEGK